MRFLRSHVAALLLIPSLALAADTCTSKTWNWKVDETEAMDLQASVNEGHQPWRTDDVSTIAAQAIEERKKEWSDFDAILDVPKVTFRSNNTARLTAKDTAGTIAYKVTLRKYSWLLKSAGEWRWIIWLPASVERTQCGKSPK